MRAALVPSLLALLAAARPTVAEPPLDVPAQATRRAETFLGLIGDGQAERAFDYLIDNHPQPQAFAAKRLYLIGVMKQLKQNFPFKGTSLVGAQTFGDKLVRLNYYVDNDHTGHGFVLVMIHFRDDWIVEHVCFVGELEYATRAGAGVFVCKD